MSLLARGTAAGRLACGLASAYIIFTATPHCARVHAARGLVIGSLLLALVLGRVIDSDLALYSNVDEP